MRKRFPTATWSPLLKSMSIVTTLLLIGAGYIVARTVPAAGGSHLFPTLAGCVLPAIAVIALLFVVIDYELDGRELRIRRLLWHTRIDLSASLEAYADPTVSQGSVRTGANGGLFSFTGYFHSTRLGSYEAYVTDWKKAVIVRLRHRLIVISPADPAAFVRELQLTFPHLTGDPR